MSARSLFISLALTACLAHGALAAGLAPEDYLDRVHGAWLGKCIGGALAMPLEGWRWPDIARAHPSIDGYLGYFSDAWEGWSGISTVARVPVGEEWHEVALEITVPEHDPARVYPVPILGMSLEHHQSPSLWEVRALRITGAATEPPFDGTAWEAAIRASWQEGGIARLDYNGERTWVKMRPAVAAGMALAPGQKATARMQVRRLSGADELALCFDWRSREPAKGFGPDDDTSYQIVGLHALQTHGPDLSCRQIGEAWCELLPAITPSLAEGLALERMRAGVLPPQSGEHPIGEAIGGQMKGEIWGLICPGRPDLAAEYARRDGVVAHCRNGVYGEQFIAAMVAAAFTEKDTDQLLDAGLAAIPADCEYARVVRWVREMRAQNQDYREPLRQIVERYPGICDPVYAEAGIVTLALLYGGGDFERTICIAASCGNDTDCNTATVGALIGCTIGAKAIPEKWAAPIDDQFRCFVKGLERWDIGELSQAICREGDRVLAFHGDGMRFSAER